jgi:predicted acyl esterase
MVNGRGLGFITPALARDTVIAGDISVDLWLKSSASDTDLQATLTEVRPDGKEVLVQSGWLRASHRKLDRSKSTVLNPVPTHLEKDSAPLPSGKWTLVRVPVFPAAHAFRAGSKIRLNIQAPGGDRQIWDFDTIEDGTIPNTIGLGGKFASRLVLPVLPGVSAKTDLPPYNALRGQPWRDYVPAGNGG